LYSASSSGKRNSAFHEVRPLHTPSRNNNSNNKSAMFFSQSCTPLSSSSSSSSFTPIPFSFFDPSISSTSHKTSNLLPPNIAREMLCTSSVHKILDNRDSLPSSDIFTTNVNNHLSSVKHFNCDRNINKITPDSSFDLKLKNCSNNNSLYLSPPVISSSFSYSPNNSNSLTNSRNNSRCYNNSFISTPGCSPLSLPVSVINKNNNKDINNIVNNPDMNYRSKTLEKEKEEEKEEKEEEEVGGRGIGVDLIIDPRVVVGVDNDTPFSLNCSVFSKTSTTNQSYTPFDNVIHYCDNVQNNNNTNNNCNNGNDVWGGDEPTF
jgi:hypothetical protein